MNKFKQIDSQHILSSRIESEKQGNDLWQFTDRFISSLHLDKYRKITLGNLLESLSFHEKEDKRQEKLHFSCQKVIISVYPAIPANI